MATAISSSPTNGRIIHNPNAANPRPKTKENRTREPKQIASCLGLAEQLRLMTHWLVSDPISDMRADYTDGKPYQLTIVTDASDNVNCWARRRRLLGGYTQVLTRIDLIGMGQHWLVGFEYFLILICITIELL